MYSLVFIVGPDPRRTRHAVRLVLGLLVGRLTLIDVVEDSRFRKCGLEEKSSFLIFCECDAPISLIQSVKRNQMLRTISYKCYAALVSKCRLSESLCRLSGHKRPMLLVSVV